MKKPRFVKVVNVLLALVLCFMFLVSIADTGECLMDTSFSFENMTAHIDKLSENGPRSIVNKDANRKALEYIVSQVEYYGVKEGDTTESPAYLIQEYVSTDETGRYQNFYLENVIVHIPANGNEKTGEAVMFMGHFDSVPMGQGSSDDGVACATMLEAIRYYLDKMENGFIMNNDLLFCFVNGEEYNLFGSRAFMEEFKGFNDVTKRIKFGTNLESRGTDGTLIMFETAKNNYNTVKLFSEINKTVFTCSIATMVYDTMPNSTDFSNFKDAYQGLNMANINGGENYHTQNDAPENVGDTYLSQQAQIVDAIIAKLASYDLDRLYDADESAVFFSYLNLTTAVYDHTAVIMLAIATLVLLILNIVLTAAYRKEHNTAKTAKGVLAVVVGFILSAAAAYACYYLFQLIAALAGVIDIHMIGTITYSNTVIVIGIGLLTLAIAVVTTYFACNWLKITRRDMTRAFAYIHAVLGIALSFILADASYLFIFSAIMLLAGELAITLVRKTDVAAYHLELLATALYFPIAIPVIFLATSALGMTMAYVYGLVFALVIFGVGICVTPLCAKLSIFHLIGAVSKKEKKSTPAGGALTILGIALVAFLAVSLTHHNASVNLQGKQNIAKLPYDDALVYVVHENGEHEYRIYDLNAYGALKKYAPEMDFCGEYYAGEGETVIIAQSVLSTAEGNVLTVKKNSDTSLVYLDFKNVNADSFMIDDGITSQSYEFGDADSYSIKLHSECTVTVNGGYAELSYREVMRDHEQLVPAEYASDSEKLHFNLWLSKEFKLGN